MNRNDKGSGKYPLPLSFLFLYQVLQILVTSDALQFILDNLLDIFLDLVVVVLNSLLHAVVAIGILEIVNDRDRLVMAFLPLYLVGVNDNLGMEDLLLDTLVEVVGYRPDEHTLREVGNLACRNEAVHLGVDGDGGLVPVDGHVLPFLQDLAETFT